MDEKRSLLKTVLIWTAAIVGVFVILHTIFVGGTNRRLQAEFARIKARGEPVSCAELGGPRIPDNINGAIVYDQAFRMMQSKPTEADVKVVEDFCSTDYSTKDAKQWAEARAAFDRLDGVTALLEEAAAYQECRFAVDWAAGAAALFPHYAPLRRSARLTAVGAVLNAREGNTAEAARLLELGLRLPESIKDEPILISALVRIAIIKIELSALRNALHCTEFSESQAKRLFDALGEVDMMRSYVKAMQGERAFGLWCFDTVRGNPGWMAALMGGSGFGLQNVAGSYPWRPFLNMDEGVYLSFMRKQVEQAAMNTLEMKEKHIELVTDANLPGYAVLSKIVLPVFSRAALARDAAIADIAVARAALALQAHKARFGAYPVSLKELRSRLGWKLPEDPFSGRDLRYKRQKVGYVLYSIGGDMKDNKGSSQPQPQGYNPSQPGDIVWSEPPPANP